MAATIRTPAKSPHVPFLDLNAQYESLPVLRAQQVSAGLGGDGFPGIDGLSGLSVRRAAQRMAVLEASRRGAGHTGPGADRRAGAPHAAYDRRGFNGRPLAQLAFLTAGLLTAMHRILKPHRDSATGKVSCFSTKNASKVFGWERKTYQRDLKRPLEIVEEERE